MLRAWEAAQAFDLEPGTWRWRRVLGSLSCRFFDKRLHPQLSGGRGMMAALYTFGFVACLVLLLACINYANLAEPRACR